MFKSNDMNLDPAPFSYIELLDEAGVEQAIARITAEYVREGISFSVHRYGGRGSAAFYRINLTGGY